MNRFTTALAFASLSGLGLSQLASAADEPPAASPPAQAAATATTSTVSSAAPTRLATAKPSTTPTAASNPDVRQMFCLNMAMQCFAVQHAASNHRLDLKAPDIRRIVPEAELREPIKDEYDILQDQEQVQVEAARPEVYVPDGLMTLPWAVMHPTQAWRIFLPVPPASAK